MASAKRSSRPPTSPPQHRRPSPLATTAPRRRRSRCRVGGGALSCLRANLRPPLKLDVQFSRIQLSWMGLRSLKRRYQRDEADQLELLAPQPSAAATRRRLL